MFKEFLILNNEAQVIKKNAFIIGRKRHMYVSLTVKYFIKCMYCYRIIKFLPTLSPVYFDINEFTFDTMSVDNYVFRITMTNTNILP